MATTDNFTTLFTHNTAGNADTVEWCPIAPYQNYFACGTYCCAQGEQPGAGRVRKGDVILFSVTRDELTELSRIQTGGILDMKWCPVLFNDRILLGTVTGTGEVQMYHLSDGVLKYLTHISLNEYSSTNYLILSLDWPKIGNNNLICCSDSNGYVTLLTFEADRFTKLNRWKAHTCETWTTCFDSFDSNVIYSGGDDNKLNIWDLRAPTAVRSGRSEAHSSGVTALSSHKDRQNFLVSGSYDESILLWDTRNWREPAEQMKSSGGLWRLKWKPREDAYHMLTACIFSGFEVVNPFLGTCLARHRGHESLAYGADWCHLEENAFYRRGQYLVALCSFYDQKLSVCLWDENMPAFRLHH